VRTGVPLGEHREQRLHRGALAPAPHQVHEAVSHPAPALRLAVLGLLVLGLPVLGLRRPAGQQRRYGDPPLDGQHAGLIGHCRHRGRAGMSGHSGRRDGCGLSGHLCPTLSGVN